MLHLLRRHPFPVTAFFRHSLVLTYAFPAELLAPLLPPGLVLDTYGRLGFLAIALVQTAGLRPRGFPPAWGQDFFLSGYRLFVRVGKAESARRGLYILRSDADRPLMVWAGNLLTHYRYRLCRVNLVESSGELSCSVQTTSGEADLDVVASLGPEPAALPAGSPFANAQEARRFAGPLPYTFSYEAETHSLISIRGVRQHWEPQPVAVQVRQCTFLAREPFCQVKPLLANAFHLRDVPYEWQRGTRIPLEPT